MPSSIEDVLALVGFLYLKGLKVLLVFELTLDERPV